MNPYLSRNNSSLTHNDNSVDEKHDMEFEIRHASKKKKSVME